MNEKDFWSVDNKVKTDWSTLPKIRKECEACFKEFDAEVMWAKRCAPCKAKNAPKRKKIINDKQPINNLPF